MESGCEGPAELPETLLGDGEQRAVLVQRHPVGLLQHLQSQVPEHDEHIDVSATDIACIYSTDMAGTYSGDVHCTGVRPGPRDTRRRETENETQWRKRKSQRSMATVNVT